jgi:hypothetical protein
MLKRACRGTINRVRRWLDEDHAAARESEVVFENSYGWLGATFQRLVRHPSCVRREAYVWGALQGIALGKVLGLERVSLIELGVAGGAGLLALEHVAETIEPILNIGVDVYGFDTGRGLPQPVDYRDCPNVWSEGYYAMDQAKLQARLRRSHLRLGLIEKTIPEFLKTDYAPVAFISFDVDLYTSTRDGLQLLDARHGALLPRVFCYFDDIVGFTFCDYNGERLAITEFNESHTMRKLAPIPGLKYFVPRPFINSMWVEMFYIAHIFDHPLYNNPDELRKPQVIEMEGAVR